MIKIRTCELEGAQLDWAVAKACGYHMVRVPNDIDGNNGGEVLAPPTVKNGEWKFPPIGKVGANYFVQRYSSDWGVGGPLIEREQLALIPVIGGTWSAEYSVPTGGDDYDVHSAFGPTLLIAAMRAFVASKLGDEVEVPS